MTQEESSKSTRAHDPSPWLALRWPAVFIALALLAFLAYRETLDRAGQSVEAMGNAAGAAADRMQQIAEGFFTGDVTESFTSAISSVEGAGTGRLEVATAEVVETLSRSEERRMAWDVLSLGTTTVEVEVPVTYRYHLRLDDPWKIEVHGPVCLVLAPAIRPSLPPALHTDRMRARTDESWLSFDGEEKMAALQRNLTPRLTERAKSPGHLAMVREPARKTVAKFVRSWLLQQNYWTDNRFATVRVIFPDEIGAELDGVEVMTVPEIQLDPSSTKTAPDPEP